MSLIQQYRDMAAGGQSFRGLSLLNQADDIGKMIRQHKAKTLLDYGSGAGDAYRQPHKVHARWGIARHWITLFDPAFREHQTEPMGVFDGVVCSDVLEHVPEADVDEVIATLFKRARLFVWASVCCRPAKKSFADGTNLHCTLRPMEWWRERFESLADGKAYRLVETP